MANHKSAIKRHRQSLKRRDRNRHITSGMRTLIKRFREAVASKDAAAAATSYTDAERAIRRAASKGVIPKRRADRSIGRLAKNLNQVSSS